MKTKTPKTFSFKLQWHAILRQFDMAVRCEVYDAVFDYVATGKTPCLSPMAEVAFAFIRFEIDARKRRADKPVETEAETVISAPDDNKAPADTAAAPDLDISQTAGLPDIKIKTYRRIPRKLKKRLKKELLSCPSDNFPPLPPLQLAKKKRRRIP